MVKLYQFPRSRRTINFSPYCLKLETYLRMLEVEYEPVFVMNPSGAPKKKFPYIVDGEVTLGDSSLIADYLEKKVGRGLDDDLTESQRAVSRLIVRTLEEGFVWVMVYARWKDPAGWQVVKGTFFRGLKAPLSWIVPDRVRKGMCRDLYGQGTGRHSRDEVYEMGRRDLDSLVTLLGKQPFFFGDKPTRADATVFGLLNNVIHDAAASPVQEYALSLPSLASYCDRMKQRFFSDLSSS